MVAAAASDSFSESNLCLGLYLHLFVLVFLSRVSILTSDIDNNIFVTPLVKMLLKKRYRLRRLGRTDAANDVANKINEIIVSIRSKRCASVGKISTKDLWAMVRGKGKVKHKHILIDGKDPSHLNQFFC